MSYAMGCDVKCASNSGFAEAVTAAKSADVVVFVIGLDQSQERYITTRWQLST